MNCKLQPFLCNKNRKDLQIQFDPDLMRGEKKGRKAFNENERDTKMTNS